MALVFVYTWTYQFLMNAKMCSHYQARMDFRVMQATIPVKLQAKEELTQTAPG